MQVAQVTGPPETSKSAPPLDCCILEGEIEILGGFRRMGGWLTGLGSFDDVPEIERPTGALDLCDRSSRSMEFQISSKLFGALCV
jgi:hypothetical protein